ncbi:hypothetical protein SKAU_G00342830 [Synaphobranchus kaupii]|uniref:Uncharacterized protein n=1 Tax=Synaphobranchus kaupii TaxID=118154 RepID=A0A9Q1EIZ4_SYNKA|nr:hypothetical protein SKAU_G00342830 [Synaphobranchus kaupii]
MTILNDAIEHGAARMAFTLLLWCWPCVTPDFSSCGVIEHFGTVHFLPASKLSWTMKRLSARCQAVQAENVTVLEGGTAQISCRLQNYDGSIVVIQNPRRQTLFFNGTRGSVSGGVREHRVPAMRPSKRTPLAGRVLPSMWPSKGSQCDRDPKPQQQKKRCLQEAATVEMPLNPRVFMSSAKVDPPSRPAECTGG